MTIVQRSRADRSTALRLDRRRSPTAFAPHAGAGREPARVVAEDRGSYRRPDRRRRAAGRGQRPLPVRGRRRPAAFPAVGDWVAIDGGADDDASSTPSLPRRTAFVRQAPGKRTVAQVVGANVDVVFVVASLNHDLNLRRLERYLAVAWESGAEPVVVLSKADLAEDVDAIARRGRADRGRGDDPRPSARSTAAASTRSGRGSGRARPSRSSARRASASRRCSTRSPARSVAAVRDDPRGRRPRPPHDDPPPAPPAARRRARPRHAGHARARAVGRRRRLERSFADIDALAAACRFGDCAHDGEPGCAIAAALADGDLDANRFEGWQKLEREARHLERRVDALARAEERRKWKAISKSVGKHMELKYGREALMIATEFDDRRRRPSRASGSGTSPAGRTTPAWPAPTWPLGARRRASRRPSRSRRSRTSTTHLIELATAIATS